MLSMEALQPEQSTLDPISTSKHLATWKPLRLLTVYRLALTIFLSVLFFSHPSEQVLGGALPELYRVSILSYVVFSLFAAVATFRTLFRFKNQVRVQILGDIIFITLLMHASGGISSSLATVLVVALAAGGLLLPGRIAYWFAAVATVAVLGETVYLTLSQDIRSLTDFAHAGLLGTAFFATAAMTHLLAQRTRESEAHIARQELNLANLTQLNEFVIHNMNTGIVVVDEYQRIRLINATAVKLLNLTSDVTNDIRHQLLAKVSPVLQQQLHHWLTTAAAKTNIIRPTASGPDVLPRFQSLGKIQNAGALIFLEDPAQMAQQAQQLKMAAVGRLTANIAHEIRNPLGAISHAGQLLAESKNLSGDDQRMNEIIQAQCQRMNTIVESVLALSRKQTPNIQQFAIKNWLDQFIRELHNLGQIENGQIVIDIQPMEMTVHFDTGNLHQVLWNLCSNALHHAKPRDGLLQIRLTGKIADAGRPFLDVTDNGIPITSEVQQSLFEPFYTTDTVGTGLGLYIARDLCEQNKANLAFHLDPEGRNTFRITFVGT